MQVASGIHQLGSDVVNFYVVEDGERLTVVDAGGAGHFKNLTRYFDANGWSLEAIEAVLLTHAHSDHVGFAERARSEVDATVHIHEHDEVLATGGEDERTTEAQVTGYLTKRAAWKTILHLIRKRGTKLVPVAEVSTFGDGEVVDVPGRPRVIHTPGHTLGSASLYLADRGVVFSGDALVTWNVLTGRDGPQIMPSPFNESNAQALRSLDRLEGLDAGVVLPGHGPHYNGGVERAVIQARAMGTS